MELNQEREGWNENPDVGPWFHCTDSRSARDIELNGFIGSLSTRDLFNHPLAFIGLLPDRERVELRESMPDGMLNTKGIRVNTDKFDWARRAQEKFEEEYPDRNYIWVSREEKLEKFGTDCFQVDLPPDSQSIAVDMDEGVLFMTESELGPERFERISSLEKSYLDGQVTFEQLVEDVPEKFYMAVNIGTDTYAQETEQIVEHRLDGATGISDNPAIMETMGGSAKNSLLVMNGEGVMQSNNVVPVKYDDPSQLVANNLKMIGRLYNNPGTNDRDRQSRMQKTLKRVFAIFKDEAQGVLWNIGSDMEMDAPHQKIARMWGGNDFKAIDSIQDFAEWLKPALKEYMKDSRRYGDENIDDLEYVGIRKLSTLIKKGVDLTGDLYEDEGEWIIRSDPFRVPAGSALLVSYTGQVSDQFKTAVRNGEFSQDELETIAESLSFISDQDIREKKDRFTTEDDDVRSWVKRYLAVQEYNLDRAYDTLEYVNVEKSTKMGPVTDKAKQVNV